MLLKSPKISVVPIPQHLSLSNALKAINTNVIVSTTESTNKYLKIFFGKKNPKIAIAGLNPHASDGGIFGDEEKKITLKINPYFFEVAAYLANQYQIIHLCLGIKILILVL